MGYLFAAFLVLWGITFAYVFSIHAQQRQASRDLDRLREGSEQHDPGASRPV